MTLDEREREKRLAEFRSHVAPKAYWHCRFDNFEAVTPDQRRALQTCRAYAREFQDWTKCDPREGLWLLGSCGVGKTHLAIALAYELQMAGRSPTVVTPRNLGRHVLEATSNRGINHDDDIPEDYFDGCGLLILDDVGADRCTDAELQQVVRLIDARYREGMPIAITSNLSVSELCEELGDRAVDRLRHGSHLLILKGPSRREFAPTVAYARPEAATA